MFQWMRQWMAFVLPLMIGAGPVCACIQRMNSPSHAAMDMTMPREHACCQSKQEQPPQPASNCEDCPIMGRAHTVIDQGSRDQISHFNWIVWAIPPVSPILVGEQCHREVAANESPPAIPGGLFHLHCMLTL